MIKNMIFDMGNVLIEWQPAKFLQRFGLTNKDDIKIITDQIQKHWSAYDKGEITQPELANKLLKGTPKHLHKYIKMYVYHWTNVSNPIEGMPEYINYLKSKGIKIFVLSNAGRNQPRYIKKYPYGPFDGRCISAYYGVAKPDKRFYETLLKKYKLKAEECAFTDDMPVNVEAAKKLGIKAFVFKNTEKLKKDLKL